MRPGTCNSPMLTPAAQCTAVKKAKGGKGGAGAAKAQSKPKKAATASAEPPKPPPTAGGAGGGAGAGSSGTTAAAAAAGDDVAGQVVTPWDVETDDDKGIDYDKLIRDFGCSAITPVSPREQVVWFAKPKCSPFREHLESPHFCRSSLSALSASLDARHIVSCVVAFSSRTGIVCVRAWGQPARCPLMCVCVLPPQRLD